MTEGTYSPSEAGATVSAPARRQPRQRALPGLGRRPKLEAWQYAGMSTTERTIALMESRGYICADVEKWIPGGRTPDGKPLKRRRDCYGIGDVLCVGPDIMLVQTTTLPHVGDRVRKITESDKAPALRRGGMRIMVHGWRKLKAGWEAKEVDCS